MSLLYKNCLVPASLYTAEHFKLSFSRGPQQKKFQLFLEVLTLFPFRPTHQGDTLRAHKFSRSFKMWHCYVVQTHEPKPFLKSSKMQKEQPRSLNFLVFFFSLCAQCHTPICCPYQHFPVLSTKNVFRPPKFS